MKYLQDYLIEKQAETFKKYKAFFAFSEKQLNEGLKKYDLQKKEVCQSGGGMIAPKENMSDLHDALNKIFVEGIQEDIAENGKKGIIIRELYNHECFLTCDLTDVNEKLEDYKITPEEVQEVFNSEKHKVEF